MMMMMILLKDWTLYSIFVYHTVSLYMFQFVSFVCNVQLTAGVEFLQYVSISVLWFLVVVEGLG